MGDNQSKTGYVLTSDDYETCGLIYRCLKSNPKLSNKEVVLKTKLPIWLVVKFRPLIESDLGLPICQGDEPPQKEAASTSINLPQIEGQGKRFIIYKKSCPVIVRSEYKGKVTKKGLNGAGIVFIEDFPCEIPGAFLDDVVKFRIEKICKGLASARLIQVIERSTKTEKIVHKMSIANNPPASDEKSQIVNTVYEGKRCIDCYSPVNDEQFDLHDGCCSKCYYKKIQSADAKWMRRSGIYGSDRAGTW